MNWIGSPQTALTAVLFNLLRRPQSLRHQDRANDKDHSSLSTDAYYILSCLNQFDTPPLAEPDGNPSQILRSLLYGLFRPLSDDTEVPDVYLTRQLLPQLAFQLRMQRRRAMIPTVASLTAFFLAFVFSVATSFIGLDYWNGVSGLAFAMLFSWLPVLVIFTAVDWNPISAERSAYVKTSIHLPFFDASSHPTHPFSVGER